MPLVDGVEAPGRNGKGRHVGDPLTLEQIRELSDGTEVVVTWDGGNGPWPYRVLVDKYGDRRVANASLSMLVERWYRHFPLNRITVGWDEGTRAWYEEYRQHAETPCLEALLTRMSGVGPGDV